MRGLEYKEPLPSAAPVEEMSQDQWRAKSRLTDAAFGTKRHNDMVYFNSCLALIFLAVLILT